MKNCLLFVALTLSVLTCTAPPAAAQASTGPGSALSFDGVDDYVDLPDDVWFINSFTFELWVMTGVVSQSTPLLQFGNDSYTDSIILTVEPGGTAANLELSVGDGVYSRQVRTSSAPLPVGQWAHVAARVNYNAGYMYVNGAQVADGYSLSMAPAMLRTNNYLGRGTDRSGSNRYAQATIDEVRIWNVTRSPTDLQADMNRPLTGSEPGLVAYWRFNEGAGTTTADATTNQLNGTLVNDPAWVPSGARFVPEAQTLPAADITLSSAVLCGTATANSQETWARFEWGTTTNYGNTTSDSNVGAGITPVLVSNSVAPLTSLTTYHFRAVASSSLGTTYGADASFTTLAKTNAELSNLLLFGASGSLYPSPSFHPSITNYSCSVENGVLWVSVVPTSADTDATLQVRINGSAFAPVASGQESSQLLLNVGPNVIEVKVTAQDAVTTRTYSIAVTRAALPPTAATLAATNITISSATLNGTVNPNGLTTIAWFQWGPTASYGNATPGTSLGTETTNLPFSDSLSGLTPGTSWHFRLVATNSAGTSYGDDVSFRTIGTNANLIALTVNPVSLSPPFAPSITNYTANVSSDITNAFVLATAADAGAMMLVFLNGLGPYGGSSSYATYWTLYGGTNQLDIRVVAEDLSRSNTYTLLVTKPVAPPLVTTGPASVVGTNGATLQAWVKPNGLPTVLWFQWGPTPFCGNSTPVQNVGGGNWSHWCFTEVTGLDPAFTYYYRPVGSNAAGVAFAELLSFTTLGSPSNGGYWDARFGWPGGQGFQGYLTALAVSGTEVYVGGNFTMAGSVMATNIAKWNGRTWSALGGGVNDTVYAIAARGTDVYAGGKFTRAGSVDALCVAKWDGSSWSALGGLNNGVGGYVYALAVRPETPPIVYVAGQFGLAIQSDGTTLEVFSIAQWDGNQWSALSTGDSAGVDGIVYAITVSGDDVYVGGDFTYANWNWTNHLDRVAANSIARWNGSAWSALIGLGQNGMNGYVNSIAVIGDEVYVGGNFTGPGAPNISRFNRSEQRWRSVGTPLGNGVDNTVLTLAASGTNVYVGGYFGHAGGIDANCIARWDGWSWSALSNGVNNLVEGLAAANGLVYVAGAFSTADGKPSERFGIWHERPPVRPALVDIRFSAADCLLSFTAQGEQDYYVERSGSLTLPNWFVFTNLSRGSSGILTVIDRGAATNAGRRYYRIRSPSP